MKHVIFLSVFLFLFNSTTGQVLSADSMFMSGICDEDGYCIPSLEGLPRPKGIEINYTRVLGYDLSTEYENSDQKFRSSVNNNRRVNFKLRSPIVLNQKLSITLGLEYEVEEFKFDNSESLNNSFQSYLNDRDLQMLGAKLYIIKPQKGDRYIASRISYRLSSDFINNSYREQSRASATLLYGKKSSKTLTWGLGLSYSYAFGRQAIYPIAAYNRIFSDQWSLDLLLPVSVKLRYMFNSKNIFILSPQISGDKYYVTINDNTPEQLYLEKSSLNLSLAYEREIHDFLWVTCGVGARTNINFRLLEKNAFLERNSPVISNQLKDALFVQAGIFLVPPRKWLEKKL